MSEFYNFINKTRVLKEYHEPWDTPEHKQGINLLLQNYMKHYATNRAVDANSYASQVADDLAREIENHHATAGTQPVAIPRPREFD